MILDNAIAINQGLKGSYGTVDKSSAYGQNAPAMVQPADGAYNTLGTDRRNANDRKPPPPPSVDFYHNPRSAGVIAAEIGIYEDVDGVGERHPSAGDGAYDTVDRAVEVDEFGTYDTADDAGVPSGGGSEFAAYDTADVAGRSSSGVDSEFSYMSMAQAAQGRT